ncbi:MAG: hypothetical protein DRN81_03130 [Thermoproteota archaeon]|nr:MAG: hypothetical protein DRN81_03130 [Candidatus Korarchaeota archaeon]
MDKEIKVFKEQAEDILEQASMAVISSQEEYEKVALIGKQCHNTKKRINEYMAPKVADAHKVHKHMVQIKKDALQNWELAAKLCATKLGEWDAKKEAKRKAEEEALRVNVPEELRGQVRVFAPPKAKGLSSKETWYAEATDINKFVKWAIEKNLPEYLLPNFKLLNDHARTEKGDSGIPGIEFKCEKTTFFSGSNK